ncbi:MAG: hypothetical protein ABI665_09300 [Vicinamibacterales bacterium]
MKTTGTQWPSILADFKAKHQALAEIIAIVETHFVDESTPGAMPDSTPVRRKPGPKPKKKKKKKHARVLPGSRAPVRAVSTPSSASTSAVAARDHAILSRLKKGPTTSAALTDALPDEPDLTADQKIRACSNALTRLRLKGDIAATADGWALA